MNKLSRRDFIKGAVAGVAGVAAAGVLGGCASESGTSCPEVEPTKEFRLGILTHEDIEESIVELEPITEFAEEVNVDVVVCGAGAAGIVAAGVALENGATVALLQKEAVPVSQGNCASAIIKSGSTPLGLKKWIHECTAFNAWRSNPELLNAYVDNSEAALKWVCNRTKVTEETEWKNLEVKGVGPDGKEYYLSKYQDTSAVFTGVVHDATQTYDYGDEKVEMFAPWWGPKPFNIGTVASYIVKELEAEFGDKLHCHFSTPVVQLVQENGKVVGCVGKDEDGKYIKFNAKSVILATGAYENNKSMVQKFCADTVGFDKKVYRRTGDGNILAMLAGGEMEEPAHSTVMHDFDAGLMYDEPFLYVNMDGKRFMNEDVEMAYISKQLRYQPRFSGKNMSADNDPSVGSKGWYCQIYDNDYMSYAKAPVPPFVMERYMPELAKEKHVSVFEELIDTYTADTIEELAKKLEVPADELVASVNRYNELCDKGADEDFGKNKEYMHKIQTPPFWGTRRHIRCSSICAGVKTNGNSQVLDTNGNVIEGLYAAGNLGGQFFGAPDYPFFQTGLSLGHAFTFGYIAGNHASKNL